MNILRYKDVGVNDSENTYDHGSLVNHDCQKVTYPKFRSRNDLFQYEFY